MGATVAVNSCRAAEGEVIRNLFSAGAALRPFVAVLAMCCLYRRPESIIMPRILAVSCGITSFPFADIGALLLFSLFLVKWISEDFSLSNVAPLLFSQSSA
jgi:hypothetical protein